MTKIKNPKKLNQSFKNWIKWLETDQATIYYDNLINKIKRGDK